MSSPVVTPLQGKPVLLLGAFDIGVTGYQAREFLVSGTATSYAPESELGSDGAWQVSASGAAEYTTRAVVLTPSDQTRFNGTVLVEWLNVSGGIDAPAVWMMAHREMLRAGYAYVAVSVQKVGVDGGLNMLGFDMSLKSQDPTRYADLSHPGDAFAYDIYSQVGALIKENGGVLDGLGVQHVIAIGESQSAMFLTTYVNAVDPLARVYDGFFVHSRFGPAAPLGEGSVFDELQSSATLAVRFRPDLRVPLLTVITETDLFGAARLGYLHARQPDTELLRVWEVPGAAHADNYTIQVAPIDSGAAPLGDLVAAYAPTDTLLGQALDHFINFGPQHHYVVQAAIAALHSWVATGAAPSGGQPMEVAESDPPGPVLDAHGLARGGIRTPWVDVPIARTSGDGGAPENLMVMLFGSGELFDAATLAQLYPGGVTDYLDRFSTALDDAVGSGFILAADRAEILELAEAVYPA